MLLALLPAPPAAAHHEPGPCDFHPKSGESVQHFSKRQIRCSVKWFGPVPGGAERGICIARRESGLFPSAQSLTGMYLGLFQHAATAWPTRYATWTKPVWQLPDDALVARSNAIVTIRMVHAARSWKSAGWLVKDCR
jgi:hypothetical protein